MLNTKNTYRWVLTLACIYSLYSCKEVDDRSSIKLSEAESLSAEPLDPDLVLVEKNLKATLNCISPNSRVVVSGSARVAPNQKRLTIRMGNTSFSVSREATCYIDIRGELMDIDGMAKIPLSNSPIDDLLYTSVRVPVAKAENPQDFLDDLSFFYKVFEIDAAKAEDVSEKKSNNGKASGKVSRMKDAEEEDSEYEADED